MNLSDRYVAALKSNGQRQCFKDDHTRGLELRVSSKGLKSWSLRYVCRVHRGRRCRHTLGTYPELSLREARDRVAVIRAKLDRVCPNQIQYEQRTAKTVAELCQLWLSHMKGQLGARTLYDDMRKIEKDITPLLGCTPVHLLSKGQLVSLADQIAARGSRVRADQTVGLVRRVYNWASAREEITCPNPALGIRRLSALKSRDAFLSESQIRALWQSLDGWPATESVKRAIKVCLCTGQRPSQVVGMRASELELTDRPLWRVPAERSKNGEGHPLPLPQLAVALITEQLSLKGRDVPIFPGRTSYEPITAHALTRVWNRCAMERAEVGLAGFRLADLRRTVGTHLARAEVPPHTIAAVLDHQSVLRFGVTGKHYIKYGYDAEKRRAMDAWNAFLVRVLSKADDDGARDAAISHASRFDSPLVVATSSS